MSTGDWLNCYIRKMEYDEAVRRDEEAPYIQVGNDC